MKKCQEKGNYQKRGNKDIHLTVKKKKQQTQMSKMKEIVNILWNSHTTVHCATCIKEVYEITNRIG